MNYSANRMRRRLAIIALLAMLLGQSAFAQDSKMQEALQKTQEALLNWDTEHMLDSLDQERFPRVVSGGVLLGSNISNFIITRDHHTMSSYMRVGAEMGGFLDFRVTKHFSIQGQLVLALEQNRFDDGRMHNHLWAVGLDLPVYFMGRYGNMEKGYLQFGAGPYTHFNFASNLSFSQNEAVQLAEVEVDPDEYESLYAIHSNYFGFGAMVGYELPFGLQINAKYQVSLSDIFTYYRQNEGAPQANASIYPQYIALGIGYRWK